jgi:hypothetical protein
VVRDDPSGERRPRARQQIDDGHRGGGSVFGAFVPATGAALTAPDGARSAATWVACLERVEGWLDPGLERVDAVRDTRPAHRGIDVRLWALAHPRWEFVFQPTKAASRNRIEPWGKGLRSLALQGRRFATWEQICQAVAAATDYWNAHRHPVVWGRRKHRRTPRLAGITRLPRVA